MHYHSIDADESSLQRKISLPPISTQQSPSLHSIFKLISFKKQQLHRNLSINNPSEHNLKYINEDWSRINLPNQSNEKRELFCEDLHVRGVQGATIYEDGQDFSRKYYQLSRIFKVGKDEKDGRSQMNYRNRQSRVITQPTVQKKHSQRERVSQMKVINASKQKHSNRAQRVDRRELMKKVIQNFHVQLAKLPKLRKDRTEDHLSAIVTQLAKFNPFFGKLSNVVGICLFKTSKIIHRMPHCLLYKSNQQLDYFYIILSGKVKLTEKDSMNKVCHAGQTILEQVLFNENPLKYSKDKARTITQTYLLQVQISQYKKTRNELIRYGYRTQSYELQVLIKRNLIIKNWIRNKLQFQANK